jgi:hypothetical protein
MRDGKVEYSTNKNKGKNKKWKTKF